jgi:hypothetical protein
MNLLLTTLLLVQLPVHFTPDRVGVRYAQSLPYGDQDATSSDSDRWISTAGETAAQAASGCGCGLAVAAAGVALAMGGIIHEDYGDVRAITAVTAAAVPAAAATGVMLAGGGLGRTGRAYLGSYLGALSLGAVGLAVGGAVGGDAVSGALVGCAVGSLPGAVVGYNVR